MFVLFGVHRSSRGHMVSMEPLARFASHEAAVEYAESVSRGSWRTAVSAFEPGSLLGSFDDFRVEDLTDLEDFS